MLLNNLTILNHHPRDGFPWEVAHPEQWIYKKPLLSNREHWTWMNMWIITAIISRSGAYWSLHKHKILYSQTISVQMSSWWHRHAMMTTKISWGFNMSDMGKIISAKSQVTFDPRGKEWRVLVAMQFPDAAILGFPHVFNINSQLFVTRLWFYHKNLGFSIC